MEHLLKHGEAPLASGDELTPSLEYTLDEPNPLHADDYERDRQPTPSSEEEEQPEKPDTPPESPTPGESSTPEGDNTVTLERQPIYAQVVKKADREPKQDKPDDTEEKPDDDDEKKPMGESDGDDDHGDKKGKDKKKKKDKKKDKEKSPKKKGENKPKVKKVQVRLKQGMPLHRSRCVACGCPRVCCAENFFYLWMFLFLLLQGGPITVLVFDFLSMETEGLTISRYIAEWKMEPAVCRVSQYDIVDFDKCKCYKSELDCDAPISGYGCMKVRVDVYTYNHSGPIANDTILWKSEREHVLNKYEPKCFNLDICAIDNDKPWYEYRNMTTTDERILTDKKREEEGFVCYYNQETGDSAVAIMEMNTSIWDVIIWFFLPLLGILLCWLLLCTCLCWYCCPMAKYVTRIKENKDGYQEVVNAEDPEGGGSNEDVKHDYDPNAMKEALYYGGSGEHMQAGKWPMSGPAAACDM